MTLAPSAAKVEDLSYIEAVAPTAWTTARAGRRLDLINPTVEMIHEDDVASALARNSRYNGWLDIPIDDIYSVAQHSVYVGRTMFNYAKECGADRKTAKRWGLIGTVHDTPEYVLGDCITPLKAVSPDYQVLEGKWEPVCYAWAGCPDVTEHEMNVLKWADRAVLLQEMLQFGRSIQWAIDGGWDQPVAPLFEANPGHSVWKPSVSYQAWIDELHFYQKY